MLRPRMLALAAFLVAVLALTACSSPSAQPTWTSAASLTRSTSGDVLASFPIPPGATVVVRNLDSAGLNIVLASITAQNATDFYRQALPIAGYTITRDADVAAGGGATLTGIEFVGHGYKGSIGGAAADPGGQSTIGISILRQ